MNGCKCSAPAILPGVRIGRKGDIRKSALAFSIQLAAPELSKIDRIISKKVGVKNISALLFAIKYLIN
jgi:hypothetical protein